MSNPPIKPLDILLVEDSPTQARLVQIVAHDLDDFNLVHICEDGDEAMQYLRRENPHANAPRPDLVLLDINMPAKDGFEVLQEMKADPCLCVIPVIMLTTSSADEDILKSYRYGASAFLSKPFELAQLKDILERFTSFWSRAAKLPPKEN